MDSDEVYKTIGYIVAVIFFIYLIGKALTLNVRVIEGLTSSKDKKKDSKDSKDSKGSKKNVKDNKYDDVDKKTTEEQSKDDKEFFTRLESKNDEIRQQIVDKKEACKDYLSLAYNRTLYLVIGLSSNMLFGSYNDKIEMPKQETLDNMNKLKTIKDYLDIVEFAYNQIDELK